ncbi:MAG: MAPEG family protein [OM182 bacterium]|nr:MAPEG family protein [OM182 bacterium]
MTQIIIATLALTLVHIWFVPAFFNRVHLKYLLGSRDEGLELSVGAARAGRAATNFQESLVPFLAMCLLAMINGVDLIALAQAWLALRVVYLVCYVGGINPARSYVWVASLLVLILMAVRLL